MIVLHRVPPFPGNPQQLGVSETTLWLRGVFPSLYTSSPFHGAGHIVELEPLALAMIRRLWAHDIDVNVNILLQALYGHDALWGAPFAAFCGQTDQPFRSKEDLSAHAIKFLLRQRGEPEEHCDRVGRAILCTNPFEIPSKIEEIVLRALDLSNLMGPYEDFSEKWDRLRQETQEASGQPVDVKTWAVQAAGYLALYLWLMLELTPEARTEVGASRFHLEALRNILRKLQEAMGSIQVIGKLGVAQDFLPDTDLVQCLLVVIDPQPTLGGLLQSTKQAKAIYGDQAVVLHLPGKPEALPVPDKTFDRFYLDRVSGDKHWSDKPWSKEIKRVLRPGGAVVVVHPG